MIELKPCAFCHVNAKIGMTQEYRSNGEFNYYINIWCTECSAEMRQHYNICADMREDIQELVKQWNTRAGEEHEKT